MIFAWIWTILTRVFLTMIIPSPNVIQNSRNRQRRKKAVITRRRSLRNLNMAKRLTRAQAQTRGGIAGRSRALMTRSTSTVPTPVRRQSQSRFYTCRTCRKQFNRSDNLAVHLRIHLNTRPYTCPICNAKFRQMGHLQKHRRTHTGNRPFACTQCPQRFHTLGWLNFHSRNFHT